SAALMVIALGPGRRGTLDACHVSVPDAGPPVAVAAFVQETLAAPVGAPFSSSVFPPSEMTDAEVLHVGAVVGVRMERQGAYVTTSVGRFTRVPVSSEANLNSTPPPDS